MRRRWQTLALALPLLVVFFAVVGGGVGEAVWLGMTVSTLSEKKASDLGVPAHAGQVVVVKLQGPALSSGVIVRDVILAVNGQGVRSVDDFMTTARAALEARTNGGQLGDVTLTLNRLGHPVTVIVPGEWGEAYLAGQ